MTVILYDIINILPLCITLGIFLYSGKDMADRLPAIYILSTLSVCFFVLLLHMKTKKRYIILGALAAILSGTALAMGKESITKFLSGKEWMAGLLLLCIFCFLIGKSAVKYRRFKFLITVSGIAALIIMLYLQNKVSSPVVCMILFYCVLTILEEIQLHWKKEDSGDVRAHIVHILPFMLVPFILLMSFTIPDKPYDWAFVKKAAASVRIRFENMIQILAPNAGWDSDSANIGFSENSSLIGNINSKPYKALSYSSEKKGAGRIYLSGKTFDFFDGRNWSKTDNDSTDYQTYDVLETLSAILGYDPDHFYDYIDPGHFYIEYAGIRTSRVFLPEKSISLTDSLSVNHEGGDLHFADGNNTTYSSDHYKLNKSYDGFDDLLSSGITTNEAGFEKAKEMVLAEGNDRYTYEGLSDYTDRIQKIYGKDPHISDRLEAFLAEEFRDTKNDADKLRKIESLLSAMEYDTSPGPLPESIQNEAEFLDHLIFEQKKGYCSHYATAFVLLSRAAGIPARYVQGYSFIIKDKRVSVMSDRAHAWPEAYIKGIGWIAYEPTPGFGSSYGWVISGASDPYAKSSGSSATPDAPSPLSDDTSLQSGSEDDDKERSLPDPLYMIIPMTFLIVFLLLFYLSDRIMGKYKYKKMDDRERALYLGSKTLKLLRRINLTLRPGETIHEFHSRSCDTVPSHLLNAFDVYESVLYSGKDVSADDTAAMKEMYENLRKYTIRQIISRFIPSRSSL